MSLQDFNIIGDGISLYEPRLGYGYDSQQQPRIHHQANDSGRGHVAAPPPTLIIMCTWLGGATDKRIQRYTQGYHHLWPTASILLIRSSNAEYAFWSARYLRRKLRPAIHAIRRINEEAADSPSRDPSSSTISATPTGTLLHIFSNGGAYVATQLVISMNTILQSLGPQPGPMPLRQIVFDSCPGGMTVERGYQAAARALPASPLRPLGRVALYLAVLGIVGSETMGIRRPLCETVQEQLNDPAVFAPGAVRVYMSSTADDIVYTEEVLAHRDEAAVRGLRTQTVVFSRAEHCALIREDEAMYWGPIASAWEKFDAPATTAACSSIMPTPTARKESGGSDTVVHPRRAALLRSRL